MGLLRNISYSAAYTQGLSVIAGNLLGGWWAGMNILYTLVILGLAEAVLGDSRSNKQGSGIIPTFILYGHALLHAAVLMTLFRGIYTGLLHDGSLVLAAISCGISAGSGAIVAAHELIHKINPVSRGLGKFLLAASGNAYFYVHHLRIHHRYVGTEQDAATARLGESMYHFYFRTIRQQFSEAWVSEEDRLAKQGRGPWNFDNYVFRSVLLQLAIYVGSFVVLGPGGPIAWFFLSYIASLLLEYVNYIEHYGLRRDPAERVNELHSWNSDKRISRFFLMDLSRHADHHKHASKPYHTLETYDASPTLPGGYASLILPAFIPAWWRSLVHPLLESEAPALTAHTT